MFFSLYLVIIYNCTHLCHEQRKRAITLRNYYLDNLVLLRLYFINMPQKEGDFNLFHMPTELHSRTHPQFHMLSKRRKV